MRILRTQGNVYVLPFSRQQLRIAGQFFKKPVINHHIELKGSSWRRTSKDVTKKLETFEAIRARTPRALAQAGRYLCERVFNGGRLLEAGCGLSVRSTIGADFQGEWIGIDWNDQVVSQARIKNPGTEYQVASAYELPFPSGHFRTAYSHTFFDVLFDPERVLLEAMRVVSPGGIIFHVMDMVPSYAQIDGQLKARGFETVLDLCGDLSRLTKNVVRVCALPAGGELTTDLILQSTSTTYQLLSVAQLLRAFTAISGISYIESGIIISVVPQRDLSYPRMLCTGPNELVRALTIDSGPRDSSRLALKKRLEEVLAPSREPPEEPGVEVYIADYILAQKAA